MNKGILVVVSGFSGAGKGTVMKRLMEKYDGYALSVSATTRKPRPGEEDGREYFFRTRDEFEKLMHCLNMPSMWKIITALHALMSKSSFRQAEM